MDSRPPLRAWIAASLAVVLGATATVGLYVVLDDYQQRLSATRAPEEKVMVIVAARTLYPGIAISEDDLIAIELPPRFVPDGAFLTPEHVVGQRPKERILPNELVRAARLSDPANGEGLNAILPREMRAISVELSDGPALSGFLDPGNSVDVLVTLDTERPGGTDVETHLLLQSLFVLGVNGVAQSASSDAVDPDQRPSVTLLVTAQQAEQVAHADSIGDLRLTLRNDQDKTWIGSDGVSLYDLVQRSTTPGPRVRTPPTPAVVEPEPAPGNRFRLIHGPDVEEVEVPDDTGSERDGN
jgi:pilus assembly protein CpaB